MDVLIKKPQLPLKNVSINIPPSKSIAHRMIICASLSDGESIINNIDFSQDIIATIEAMKNAGANITKAENSLKIKGVFYNKPQLKTADIFCCESGSTLRFLIPIFSALFDNDTQISFSGCGKLLKRPQTVYEKVFKEKNIFFKHSDIIQISGGLDGGEFFLDGNVSSQFISGLMMALPLCKKDSIIKINPPFESKPYVDLTIDCLNKFGVTAKFLDENTIFIKSGNGYKCGNFDVEGDYSQLAFWAVLGCVYENITTSAIDIDSLQGDKEILNILKFCGGKYSFTSCNNENNESAQINQPKHIVFKKSDLSEFSADLANCPDLGPILTVLAAFCNGKSVLNNTQRLKIKESDRVYAMKCELEKLDVKYEYDENKIVIWGLNKPYNLKSTVIFNSHNDHRIAMSCAIAGICYGLDGFIIKDAHSVCKSYPLFFNDLKSLGIEITEL